MDVSLAEVKAHLRIDHTDDDDYLAALIDTCKAEVQNYTGRKMSEFATPYDSETGDGFDDLDRQSVKHAIFIKCGEYYDQDRANYILGAMKSSNAFNRLLNPYIKI